MPTFNGTAGDDTINGSAEADEIRAGAGADIIDAGDGDDRIYIEDLGEVVTGEQINGGAGYDTIIALSRSGLPDDSYYDISAAVLTGIEQLGTTLQLAGAQQQTIGLTASQLTNAESIAGMFFVTTTGAIALGGVTAADRLFITLNPEGNTIDLTGFVPVSEVFVGGGDGDDTVIGWAGYDNVYARGGDDILYGNGGNDQLIGGEGNDTIHGGADNDTIEGDLGDDILDGGTGDDYLDGEDGNDTATYRGAAAGVVVDLNLQGAQNTVGLGIDTLRRIENLVGSNFADRLIGNDRANILTGAAGADVLTGGLGGDTFSGSAADQNGDTITDFAIGDRIVFTDATLGSFTFSLSGNTLTFTGGSLTLATAAGGTLVASAASGGGVQLSLQSTPLIGTDQNDVLNGTAQSDQISGLGGDDTLNGLGGNDILAGGAGSDILDGGDGNDTVDYTDETGLGRVYVNLSATARDVSFRILGAGQAFGFYDTGTDTLTSIENVITGSDDDYVIGSDVANRIETGDGFDYLEGGGGADVLIGGMGDDSYLASQSDGDIIIEYAGGGIDEIRTYDAVLSLANFANVENVYGYSASGHTFTGSAEGNILAGYTGADTIFGESGDDEVYGGSGNDLLYGGPGMDFVSGGSGDDTLLGGDGSDTLRGGTGVDTLTGGAGNDTFADPAASLNGDTITDMMIGDRIIVIGATLANFTFSLSGSTLNFTGGSLTIAGGLTGSLVASAAAGGGVQLALNDPRNDFNGDGRSDILWRNANGDVTNWLGQTNGSFVGNAGNSYNNPGAGWTVVGTADFNGDGRHDVLWRNTAGDVTSWLGQTNGNFVGSGAFNNPGVSWSVAGTGDFNGDGRDDILWRDTAGNVTNWLGQTNGNFAGNAANSFNNPGAGWSVAGTGDFNGDGRDDILWRNGSGDVTSWLGQTNGNFAGSGAFNNPGAGWSVVGTGDFNGDGRDDILWRDTSGNVTNWLGQANGNFVGNAANSFNNPGAGWSVIGVGDYNGDGRDDILWRNTAGDVTNWLGQANGNFAGNAGASYNPLDNGWHVQPEYVL